MPLRKTSITLQPEIEAKLMDLRKKFGGQLAPAGISETLSHLIAKAHESEYPPVKPKKAKGGSPKAT